MGGVALLSGGLDSMVAAAHAVAHGGLDLAVTVDYGQRARRREVDAARLITSRFGVRHRVVEVPFLGGLSPAALCDESAALPEPAEKDLDDEAASLALARQVWIPNRNGFLINLAACYAEHLEARRVVVGFNAEEAATFPDNSRDYLAAATQALSMSTRNGVEVEAPTLDLDKSGIVELGLALKAPLELVWSCYSSETEHCWRCSSCLRLKRALDQNGVFERFFGTS